MANLIGGIAPFPGTDNRIAGTVDRDIIFGDPFTTGASFFDEDVPEVGGPLASGRGGDDRLGGVGAGDNLYGDAFDMSGDCFGWESSGAPPGRGGCPPVTGWRTLERSVRPSSLEAGDRRRGRIRRR